MIGLAVLLGFIQMFYWNPFLASVTLAALILAASYGVRHIEDKRRAEHDESEDE